MGGFPILSALTFLPLVGALIIMAVRAATAGSSSSESANEGRTALLAGLVISGATFLVSLTFRILDAPLCGIWPLGTHPFWHLLNAATLGLLLAAAIDADRLVPRQPVAGAPSVAGR